MYVNVPEFMYVNVLDTAHKIMTDILIGYKLSKKMYIAVLFFWYNGLCLHSSGVGWLKGRDSDSRE